MPDSPADVKSQTRTTPPTMPPPSPALSQGTNRTSSYTPSTMMNGSGHSPTAINGAPSTPNGFSNGPSASSSAALTNQQLPPACGARQLSKLKRFLTTLQQFGSDISPEIGERVRALVLGLVNSTLTIEEFHSKLQEATNFPLRPFVIPFLKANLPLLQRELLHCARLAKQSPAQYLAQHEQLLLDTSVSSSPNDASEHLLLEVNENGKRRTPDRTKENAQEGLHPDHLAKRPCTTSPAQRYSPSNGLLHPPTTNGLPHPTPPPTQHYRLEDMVLAHHYRHTDPRELRDRHRQAAVHEVIDHRLTEREWAEEWKHLNNLLNCIMDMVEKTRRSLTVLRRCQEADREELNHWIRRYSDAEDLKKNVSSVAQPARHHSSSSSTESSPAEPSRDFLHRPPPAGYMPEEIWRKADPGGGGVWADRGRFSPQWDVGLAMSDKIPKQEPGLSEGDHGDEGDLDDPELTAIRMRVREMEEETERLKDLMTDETSTNSPMTESREQSFPYTHRRAGGASLRQVPRAHHAGPNWPVPFRLPFMERNSPFYGQPKGLPQPATAEEKQEADKRSVYVGNVDYGGTAQDLESHFSKCGSINRITILCDRYSGHPKGYAYIEFTEPHSAETATELDESVFRGRTIKVLPKRTNVPGISTTDRGNFRGRFRGPRGNLSRGQRSRGPMSRGQYSRGQMSRGQGYRGRGRSGWWNNQR